MNDIIRHHITGEQPLWKPEWLRFPDATKIFGVSRSKIYELISAGQIRSFSLRGRGKKKGVRLISYDSLKEFLERRANEKPVEKEVA